MKIQHPKYISIRIEINRSQLKGTLALILLVWAATKLSSETMTLTTYYPAPVGVYRFMTTTQKTVLARDGGSVGIGTASPGYKLDVVGTINASVGVQNPVYAP